MSKQIQDNHPIFSQMGVKDNAEFLTLAAELEIPIISGRLQHQGDVSVVPSSMSNTVAKATTPVPATGVPVVAGENGGNTHLLLATGTGVFFDRAKGDETIFGSLVVQEGSTAWLDHPEHGNSGVGPGTYYLTGKREQADEIRRVAD